VTEWWRRLPGPARVVAVAVAGVIALELALGALETATGGSGPSGPVSSSYATSPAGLAAYADLLARAGHPVTRVRTALHDLDPATTLVVADAPVDTDEVAALRRFVSAGGRLVLAGQVVTPVADDLVPGTVHWRPASGDEARPVLPGVTGIGDLAAIGTVRTAGEGAFDDTGAALPFLAADGRPLAAISTPRDGLVVLLADASPLQNRLLDQGGNAALGLLVAGEPGRPVAFSEAGHGYGPSSGLDALPSGWAWALVGAAFATLVWVWSRARRLGPPAEDDVEPLPARRAYVDAMAATLLRTGDPAGAIAPVQAAGRRRLARRTGVAPDADDQLRAAGSKVGVSELDLDAIISPVRSHDDAVRAARALTRLGPEERP
jgi:hypothetical protein